MSQKVEINGEEVEVFTTEEVAARETAVRGEFEPKLTAAEQEKTRLEGLLGDRTRELGNARTEFKRLTDEQYGKLGEAEKIIYDNQRIMSDQSVRLSEADKKVYDSTVATAIRALTGADEALFTKVKGMYDIIGLEDMTPEGVTARARAAFGAVGQNEPDLLAAAGFSGGGYVPPSKDNGATTFADTERGKEIANALGIKIELTDAEKKALGQ